MRHQLTAAWRVRPGIRLIGGYEIADGSDHVARTARVGVDLTPWTGAKVTSIFNNQATGNDRTDGENGGRTYAQYGLSQSLPLGRGWTVDATLDASDTIGGRVAHGALADAFQPLAPDGAGSLGQAVGDYTAVTLGATYRAARWSWNGRIEHRDAAAEDRWGLTTDLLRGLGRGRTLASSVKAYRIVDGKGAVAAYAAADVALALRPIDSPWSLLERLELRHERADAGFDDRNALGVPAGAGGDQITTRIVNNLAVNYRGGAEGLGHGIEASVHYGAKYVRGRFGDDVLAGYIDVAGFDLRRDLGSRFDVGIAGSVQHAWRRGAWAWSGGPSAGFSPAPDMWISAGYNLAGYRDRDFADDRYTRRGVYVTVRRKFDQFAIARAVRALRGS